jgi:hypothetical protein
MAAVPAYLHQCCWSFRCCCCRAAASAEFLPVFSLLALMLLIRGFIIFTIASNATLRLPGSTVWNQLRHPPIFRPVFVKVFPVQTFSFDKLAFAKWRF